MMNRAAVVEELCAIARSALKRMYRPSEHVHAFRIRRSEDGKGRMEGVSDRYTAIVLIGLADEPSASAKEILLGQDRADLCGRLIERIKSTSNLGDAALTLWAARALDHPAAAHALARLKQLDPAVGAHPTVEVAWSLSALSAPGRPLLEHDLARRIADRLLASFNPNSGIFPHMPAAAPASALRRHVACFADLVYPTQALSFYSLLSGDDRARQAARTCADRMCALQGPDGQWWWHFDVRSGRVIEGYPVYAVHQNSMAPMALFAAEAACGKDYGKSIERGLEWLLYSPEIKGTLIERTSDTIWRKVYRNEPGKFSRTIQAAACCLHPSLRIPCVSQWLRPTRVDDESRPYHMGWILFAWSNDQARRFLSHDGAEETQHGRRTASIAGAAHF